MKRTNTGWWWCRACSHYLVQTGPLWDPPKRCDNCGSTRIAECTEDQLK